MLQKQMVTSIKTGNCLEARGRQKFQLQGVPLTPLLMYGWQLKRRRWLMSSIEFWQQVKNTSIKHARLRNQVRVCSALFCRSRACCIARKTSRYEIIFPFSHLRPYSFVYLLSVLSPSLSKLASQCNDAPFNPSTPRSSGVLKTTRLYAFSGLIFPFCSSFFCTRWKEQKFLLKGLQNAPAAIITS